MKVSLTPSPLASAIRLAMLSCVVVTGAAQAQSVIPLSGLDGSNGFRLDGVSIGDYSGQSVASAGDVNGDGIDDLIIGAYRADPNGTESGASYVVFGRPTAVGFAPSLDLSSLNGSNGFRLEGVSALDVSGVSVAGAGDINGDGLNDIVVGATSADPNGAYSGSSYVVFGRPSTLSFAANINLGSLNGSNGFRLDGALGGDQSGRSVAAAGDINSDGIDDLIISADGADSNGLNSGSNYVVFGRSGAVGFASSLNLSTLNGSNGFRLAGAAAGDRSGTEVASAGDVNGDSINDLIVSAYEAQPHGSRSGSSYVVFGRSSSTGFASSINLGTLNGSTGFRLDGVAAADYSGVDIAGAGDINGDGIDDLIIGANGADVNGSLSGSSYVVFGRPSTSGVAAVFELSSLNGSNGFRLDGEAAGDRSGFSVAAAGDVNGDGIGDLIVGAYGAKPNGFISGSSYVLFGRPGAVAFGSVLNLGSLNGNTGFRLDGAASGYRSGCSVAAAGDVNSDGIDDLIIGAWGADLNGSGSGSAFVVFGDPAISSRIFRNSFESP